MVKMPDSNAKRADALVEHLFREESGKMLATLTRLFSFERLDLAEDIVQDTFVAALRTWSFEKVPDNPSAWLMRVAKNKALNALDRVQTQRRNAENLRLANLPTAEEVNFVFTEHELRDNRLQLLFACCQPSFPIKAQVIFTLKSVCGLGISEIAAGLLMSDAAVAKALVRVKQQIRDEKIPFEVPDVFESATRMDGVLATLYLLFNEGYRCTSGTALTNADLCAEAIRLTRLIVQHVLPQRQEAYALLALFYFHAARLPERVNLSGEPLLLRDQNRSAWDETLIAEGFSSLRHSRGSENFRNQLTRYHLEAGIAATHCAAKNFEETDWSAIVRYYDFLEKYNLPFTPLNRAIAIGFRDGAEIAISALIAINKDAYFNEHAYYWAALGSFLFDVQEYESAEKAYQQALKLSRVKTDRQFLLKRIVQCQNGLT